MRKIYKVEEDLKPYLFPLVGAWKAELFGRLPNLEEITDMLEAVKAISSRKYVDYYNSAVLLPTKYNTYEHRLHYVSVYTTYKSGGNWDGVGYVVTTNEWPDARVFKFQLCIHEKTEEGHRPNHTRGWHPGHCKHCNMDMTVDSGD